MLPKLSFSAYTYATIDIGRWRSDPTGGGGQEGINSLPVALDGECRLLAGLSLFWAYPF